METISVAIICSVVGAIAAVITLQRDSKKTTVKETESSVSVKEEIKYISKGIEDIKYDTRSLSGTLIGISERLIRAEEGIKNNSRRIDNFMEKGDK